MDQVWGYNGGEYKGRLRLGIGGEIFHSEIIISGKLQERKIGSLG